jgi:hypothetical protein
LQNVTKLGFAERNANIALLFSENDEILGIVSKSFVLGSPAHDWK